MAVLTSLLLLEEYLINQRPYYLIVVKIFADLGHKTKLHYFDIEYYMLLSVIVLVITLTISFCNL